MPTRASPRPRSNWPAISLSTISGALTHRWAERRRTRHTSETWRRKTQLDVESLYSPRGTVEDPQPQGLHLRNQKTCPNKRGHLCAHPTTRKEVTAFRVADGSIRADSVRQI